MVNIWIFCLFVYCMSDKNKFSVPHCTYPKEEFPTIPKNVHQFIKIFQEFNRKLYDILLLSGDYCLWEISEVFMVGNKWMRLKIWKSHMYEYTHKLLRFRLVTVIIKFSQSSHAPHTKLFFLAYNFSFELISFWHKLTFFLNNLPVRFFSNIFQMVEWIWTL